MHSNQSQVTLSTICKLFPTVHFATDLGQMTYKHEPSMHLEYSPPSAMLHCSRDQVKCGTQLLNGINIIPYGAGIANNPQRNGLVSCKYVYSGNT